MNKLIALTILILMTTSHSVVIGKQDHMKQFASTTDVEHRIDSLVALMDEYLSKPMSWCEVTPTGFNGTKPVGGSMHKGYVSVNIELTITCDNNRLMDAMESIYENAYEVDSKRRTAVGVMWDGYNSMNFSKAIRKAYHGISYEWDQGATEMRMFIGKDFAGENQGSPVLGRILVNGTPLVDDYLIDHKYGNEWSSPDIFRFMVEDCYIVRVAVESPKVPNAKELNNEYRHINTYTASVSYLIRGDKAAKLLDNANIDVTIDRVYNHQTPGTLNRSYHFLGYLQ